MSDDNNTKYIRLTYENRLKIEECLNENRKLKDIASEIDHNPRTISYEIYNHRYLSLRKKNNMCTLFNECKIKHLCNDCKNGSCKHCRFHNCNELCTNFTQEPTCKRVNRYPFVCNGCPTLKECNLNKYYYKADIAHKEYKNNISDYKRGCKLTTLELKDLDYSISQAIRNGHSIAVAIKEYQINKSISTMYRYVNAGILSVKNIDLKRKVRYKCRKKKQKVNTQNYDYLRGRNYELFTELIINDPTLSFWQMDTIVGTRGSDESVILSLLHNKSNLQLYFKLKAQTSDEVKRVFDYIKSVLGSSLFSQIFSIILTDNGSEFKDPISLEIDDITGEKLISIYYCQSRRADQKGKCEKNHEHFREMIPKGNSFNNYTDDDINYISLMINNYPRAMFNYKSPIEVASNILNKKAFSLNNLNIIPTKQVKLKRYIK